MGLSKNIKNTADAFASLEASSPNQPAFLPTSILSDRLRNVFYSHFSVSCLSTTVHTAANQPLLRVCIYHCTESSERSRIIGTY
jgi:hypothetical protein